MALRDSHERFAEKVLLRGGEDDKVQVSRSVVQFWIQLIVMVITISAWGMSSRSDVAQLADQLKEQTVQTSIQRDKTDMLEKKIELLRYELGQLQLSLASKGVLSVQGE